MNTFIYFGAVLLCLGWLVLIILSITYQFKEDEQIKQHPRSLPKANPIKETKTGTPE